MTSTPHDCGVITHVGKVRRNNEDSVLVSESIDLWIVADGVGGGVYGQVASELTAQTIERRVRQGESLDESIRQAHSAVKQLCEASPEYKGMATTAVVCQLQPAENGQTEILWSWIGDSRLYLITESGLEQLSSDHNMAEELAAKGEISEGEAQNHSSRHVLTQAIGASQLRNVPLERQHVAPGQGFLLCSDGLSGVLNDNEIYTLLHGAPNAQVACEKMIEAVLSRGAPDNVSIIVVYPNLESDIASSPEHKENIPEPQKKVTQPEESESAPQNEGLQLGVSPIDSRDESSAVSESAEPVSSEQDDSNSNTIVKNTEDDGSRKSEPEPEAVFGQVDGDSYRLPFDKSMYRKHCKARPPLIFIILVSVIILLFFV